MALDIGTLVGYVDLDATRFDRTHGRVDTALRALGRLAPDVKIGADDTAARRVLDRVAAGTRSLPGGTVEVDADARAALDELSRMEEEAARSGQRAGEAAGQNITDGVESKVGALAGKGGPIAGAILGAVAMVASLSPGVLLMDAITKGMDRQATQGVFSARTGLDAATAAKFGKAAGESYASNFGESIEANLDAGRRALQAGLVGGDATQREITEVINGLTTVADILGEEVPAASRTAGQLLKTGLAGDATQAFDLIVKAQQAGLNGSEDLLDTFNEYGTQFRKLGLDGPLSVGLLSQAVRAGARDTDVAADALKEFSIRAVDGSELSAQGFASVGLNAKEMTAQIAAGGEGAKAGLDAVLDGLRGIEDPVARDAAAVALFGTQAEDLGAALFAFDASTAIDQLGQVGGAANKAADDIANNPAAAAETAKRAIATAASDIQMSLAQAFGPGVTDAGTWVSTHREEIVTFLLDSADLAIDLGRAFLQMSSLGLRALAALVEAQGEMSSAWLGGLQNMTGAAEAAFGWVPGLGDKLRTANDAVTAAAFGADVASDKIADGMRDAADGIDETLIPALDGAQDRLDEMAIPAQAQAALADATSRGAAQIATVGQAADGSKLQVAMLGDSFDKTRGAGAVLNDQLIATVGSMKDQARAGVEAGQGADELTAAAQASRDALIDQLQAMGLTREQAERLADSYGAIPANVVTVAQANGFDAATGKADAFRRAIQNIPTFKSVTVQYNEREGVTVRRPGFAGRQTEYSANGNVFDFYADGGLREDHVAQIASAGAMRVWAEPETGGEAYIPLAPSKRARSMALMQEVADRFGASLVPESATRGLAAAAASPAPAAAVTSAGAGPMRIYGTLDLGNGLTGLIDGVLDARDAAATDAMAYRTGGR